MSRTSSLPTGETRTRKRSDILAPWPAQAMLGLLDRDPGAISEGDPLPLGWHWLYFRHALRSSRLAPDGHETRGTFMPDVDLPRRMWAGGTLRSLRPVSLGESAELRSEILNVAEKRGQSGRLVFVTAGHTVLQHGHPCVQEEQMIVYREPEPRPAASTARPAAASPARPPADMHCMAVPEWTETFLPTTVTLFQFSALTYNGHRIHYDHPYVTEREGYPGLLVHGPLTALLLLDAARRHAPAPVSSFRYRALAPLFVDEPITLAGYPPPPMGSSDPSPERVVEALGPSRAVAMRAWVR